jgi:hypothetical protein
MDHFDALEKELPPLVWRSALRFKEWTGLSSKAMANLDCAGQGPRERIRQGARVAYPRKELVRWLRERCVMETAKAPRR